MSLYGVGWVGTETGSVGVSLRLRILKTDITVDLTFLSTLQIKVFLMFQEFFESVAPESDRICPKEVESPRHSSAETLIDRRGAGRISVLKISSFLRHKFASVIRRR